MRMQRIQADCQLCRCGHTERMDHFGLLSPMSRGVATISRLHAAHLGDVQAGRLDVAFGGPVQFRAEQPACQRADQVSELALGITEEVRLMSKV